MPSARLSHMVGRPNDRPATGTRRRSRLGLLSMSGQQGGNGASGMREAKEYGLHHVPHPQHEEPSGLSLLRTCKSYSLQSSSRTDSYAGGRWHKEHSAST